MSKTRVCSFCGRPLNNNMIFMEGGDGSTFICEDCLQLMYKTYKEIPSENTEKQTNSLVEKLKNIPKPKEIKDFIDKYVIGQDKAKRIISTAIYNHYKRILNKDQEGDVELLKSNIVICGPTGCGKTEIARTVARMIDVPFVVVDATTFTESGYVGEDVESILSRLYQAANCDKERTELGIVFIDEIDKIAKRSTNGSITKEVRGEGVQQALLKLLEDSIVNVPPKGGRKHPDQDYIKIDTKNILFIASGAFVGLEDKVKARFNKRSIGFIDNNDSEEVDEDNILAEVTPKDLKSFGFIPELIGRLPVIAHVDKLTQEQLVQILTEPKNSVIKQYQKLFEMDGIKLTFDKDVYDWIANQAIENEIGARGLRGIVEKIMEDYMFEAPSGDKKKIRVTMKYINTHIEKNSEKNNKKN